jgi:multiple sugar transport system substrate-binding protein
MSAIPACRFYRVAALLGVVSTGILLSGCPSPKSSGRGPKQHEAQVIRVACPGEPAHAMIDRYSRRWASSVGARVEVVDYARGSEPPEADVWIVQPAEMPRWANAGRLLPVPDEYTAPAAKYDWGDVLPVYRDKLCVWNRAICALPILGEGLLCFYRDDLFQEPARQNAFRAKYHRELTAPATWAEFADIAEFFHGDKQIAGLAPLPADDEQLDREFFSVVAPFERPAISKDAARPSFEDMFSFHYDLGNGDPLIATFAFVHGLTLLKRLQPTRAAGTGAPAECFRRGKCALCLADASWIGRFQEADAPVRNRYGICAVPGSDRVFDFASSTSRQAAETNRIPYLGGAGLLGVVPQGSTHPEAAFSLLGAISGPDTSAEAVMEPAWGGDVFRQSQFTNRGAWDTFDLTPARTNSLIDSLHRTLEPSAINPVIRLRTPDQGSHLQALMQPVRAALTDPKIAPAQALATTARRWHELDAKTSVSDRLRLYRLSLGLRGESGGRP